MRILNVPKTELDAPTVKRLPEVLKFRRQRARLVSEWTTITGIDRGGLMARRTIAALRRAG